jgi:hypothetical protein
MIILWLWGQDIWVLQIILVKLHTGEPNAVPTRAAIIGIVGLLGKGNSAREERHHA